MVITLPIVCRRLMVGSCTATWRDLDDVTMKSETISIPFSSLSWTTSSEAASALTILRS